jgi:putative ABC transport system permease protein
VTVQRGSADLSMRMARLAEQYPETNSGRTAYAVPLRDEIAGPVRPLLLALGGAVALVLLVACANVASLFLSRALARSREVEVRVALGAGPGRIIRQLLTESVLIAVAGGAAGAALAWGGVRWLAAAAPTNVTSRMPFFHTLTVDGRVLWIALLVALLTGVAFGLAPAMHASRLSLSALRSRDGGEPAGGFGSRAWRTLIVMEIALTTVLLVGAGLMTRSVRQLLAVDPGFRMDRVVTMRLALAGARYDDERAQQRFFEALIASARALRGAPDVGAVSNLPMAGGGSSAFRVEGEPEAAAAARPTATLRSVAGDYFAAMGIPVVDGRAINSRDDSSAAPVVVLSKGLAQRLFGGGRALGRKLRFYASPETVWTVVGVVGDVRAASLDAPAPPIIYRSHLQAAENRMTVVISPRGSGGRPAVATLIAAMKREAGELDPLLPPYQVGTMADMVASTPAVYLRRYLLMLLAGFAAAATLLAAVGVYGVIAYAAARRTREMGIRSALGATPRSLLALVLRQGAVLAAIGIALGLIASAALSRVLASLLYGVRPTDHPTYAATAALLATVATLASLVPARRAARVDPANLLRAE